MVITGSDRFNCGEYRPGQEPIYIPPLFPPSPPVIVPLPIEPRLPNLPQYPRPRGPGNPDFPGTGNPGTGTPGIPVNIPGTSVITHPGQKYRCGSTKFYCPDDKNLPEAQRRVVLIKRLCSVCDPYLDVETNTYKYDPDCIYRNIQECQQACVDSNYPNACISVTDEPIFTEEVIQPQTGRVNIPDNTVVINPNIVIPYNQVVTDPIRPGEIILPTLYHPTQNLFRYVQSNETVLTTNIYYRNIFNQRVASEVFYLLDNQNTVNSWDERIIQNLTLPKIEISVLPSLINAFDQISFPGGILVGKNYFLEAIRRHLLEGTLDEFDTSFYLNTHSTQRSDPKVTIQRSNFEEFNERAAIGLLRRFGIPVDSSKVESINLRQIRRQKRLNEDLEARIPVCPLEIDPDSLYIENAGVCLHQESNIDYPLENGDGDGYYLYLNSVEEGCIPLTYESNVSSAYYIPNNLRAQSLRLMGVDPNIVLRAESTSSFHEFTTQNPVDDPPLELKPIYFALELSSVSGELSNNPLIDKVYAKYSMMVDQDEIDRHTNSNGFSVTKVNIDFRDPIYRYISDTSSVELTQNDITFRAFDENVAILDREVYTRNIPFGLIVTPVRGSKHNPFNGFSKVTSYGSTVRREIRMCPTIQYSDKGPQPNPLQMTNLYDEGDLRVGVFEPNDVQNITYRFNPSAENLVNSYFSGGIYISSIDSVSSHGISYLIRDVLDYIVSEYDPEEISWFEIYRRMPLNKFGELLYNSNNNLLLDLASGYRNNIRIRHNLNRLNSDSIQLLDEDSRVVLQR